MVTDSQRLRPGLEVVVVSLVCSRHFPPAKSESVDEVELGGRDRGGCTLGFHGDKREPAW